MISLAFSSMHKIVVANNFSKKIQHCDILIKIHKNTIHLKMEIKHVAPKITTLAVRERRNYKSISGTKSRGKKRKKKKQHKNKSLRNMCRAVELIWCVMWRPCFGLLWFSGSQCSVCFNPARNVRSWKTGQKSFTLTTLTDICLPTASTQTSHLPPACVQIFYNVVYQTWIILSRRDHLFMAL